MALTGVRLQFTLGANEMRRDTKFLTIAVHHDINMHIICQNHCGIVFLLVHYDVGGSNAFSSLTYYFVEWKSCDTTTTHFQGGVIHW